MSIMQPTEYEHPDYWSREATQYTGVDCENCNRSRVELYTPSNRRVCEKCNWDQDAHDYAYDHHQNHS